MSDHPSFKNSLMKCLFWVAALVAIIIPLMMMWDILNTGLARFSLGFLLSAPEDAGRSGGIGTLLVSTAWILAICMMVTLPLGVSCALYLSEFVQMNSAGARWTGYCLDILSGVPSIVFGLFGYLFFAQILGFGFSILSGGLTLACMVLPIFIRLTEQSLRSVPLSYRKAAVALNISLSGYIVKILLPAAAPGIIAGTIISIGRALAETAVLIFTAGYVTRMPTSVYDSGRTLSVHIYDMAMNVPGGTETASATALVLVIVLVGLNLIVRKFIQRWQYRYHQTHLI